MYLYAVKFLNHEIMNEIRDEISRVNSSIMARKRDDAIKIYDEMAEYGASILYAEVDNIVQEREIDELSEKELDSILSLIGRLEEFKRTSKKNEK